jgi:hypothetical protein
MSRNPVIPAQAGIHLRNGVPAFAGTTMKVSE